MRNSWASDRAKRVAGGDGFVASFERLAECDVLGRDVGVVRFVQPRLGERDGVRCCGDSGVPRARCLVDGCDLAADLGLGRGDVPRGRCWIGPETVEFGLCEGDVGLSYGYRSCGRRDRVVVGALGGREVLLGGEEL